MPAVTLSTGTIHYEKSGPDTGRPIVFIHGYGMGSSLWRAQSERLAGWGSLCLAPTWPLGAHTEPMNPGAEQTMEGIAALVSEFLDALGLDDVVLVGNDTGGAIAQIVVTAAPARVGALVLTSCDAFEHFPPPILRPLITAAKLGPLFTAAMAPMRTRAGRRMAYGALAHADIEDLVREWVGPAQTDSRVRDDLRRFTASLNTDTTIKAAERLPRFTKPALIAWSADDAFFALEDGRRLAQVLPNARFELIERARTFSMIDQPDVLAELIAELADGTGEPARSQRPDALPAQNAA